MYKAEISGYRWNNVELTCAHEYLKPTLMADMVRLKAQIHGNARVSELGCGNGSVANFFACEGLDVAGVDPSTDGIAQANARYPALRLEDGSAYDRYCA